MAGVKWPMHDAEYHHHLIGSVVEVGPFLPLPGSSLYFEIGIPMTLKV
jgi:hypothetical protein